MAFYVIKKSFTFLAKIKTQLTGSFEIFEIFYNHNSAKAHFINLIGDLIMKKMSIKKGETNTLAEAILQCFVKKCSLVIPLLLLMFAFTANNKTKAQNFQVVVPATPKKILPTVKHNQKIFICDFLTANNFEIDKFYWLTKNRTARAFGVIQTLLL